MKMLFIVLLSVISGLAQMVGQPAPPFTHNTLSHGQVSLSDYAGKVVYLYFFGYNCPPCLTFGPITEQIHQNYLSNPSVAVLGLDVWDGTAAQVLTNFQQPTGVTYPLCLNASTTGGAYQANVDWNVVVDQQQIIRYHQETSADPVATANEIIRVIDSLLAVTGIQDSPRTPRRLKLYQNFPNPFNPSTRIRFELPSAGHVRLEVINLLGQPVHVLLEGFLPAGTHQVEWEGRDQHGRQLPAGLYFYRLTTAQNTLVRKMVLLP